MPNGIKRVFCCLKSKNTEPKQGYRRCKLGSSLTKNVLASYRSHGLESLVFKPVCHDKSLSASYLFWQKTAYCWRSAVDDHRSKFNAENQ